MPTYCEIGRAHPIHRPYHDTEYGFPAMEDNILFERLILEINQAGLSWLTILKKRNELFKAYDGFDVGTVATYGNTDRKRLMSDGSIIRNRLKIDATIENAIRIQQIKNTHGSFKAWIDDNHPMQRLDWVKLFKHTFKFTGTQITTEFLMSLGYLPGAHDANCPIQEKIKAMAAPWTNIPDSFWHEY